MPLDIRTTTPMGAFRGEKVLKRTLFYWLTFWACLVVVTNMAVFFAFTIDWRAAPVAEEVSGQSPDPTLLCRAICEADGAPTLAQIRFPMQLDTSRSPGHVTYVCACEEYQDWPFDDEWPERGYWQEDRE